MRGKDLLKCMTYIDDGLIQEASTSYILEKTKTFPFYIRKWNAMIACVLCVFIIGITVTIIQPWNQYSSKNDSAGQNIDFYLEGLSEEEAESEFTDKANGKPAEDLNKEVANDVPEEAFKEEASFANQELEKLPDDTHKLNDQSSIQSFGSKEALLERRENYQIIDSNSGDNDIKYCYGVSEKGTYNFHALLQTEIENHKGENVLYYVTVIVFGDIKNENEETSYYALYYNDSSDRTKENDLLNQEFERLKETGYDVEKGNRNIKGYFTQQELDKFTPDNNLGYLFTFENDM